MWISAPEEVALRRLQTRTTPRVPVSEDEASWIYDAATARASSTRFDLRIDTSSGITPKQVIEAVPPLVAESIRDADSLEALPRRSRRLANEAGESASPAGHQNST